jgi:hypothetical protein
MTYACPTWEYAADARPLKLQSLQNRVLRVTGNLDKCTPVREFTWLSKFLTCRAHVEVILNNVNPNVRGTGQGEARHTNHKRFKLGGGQAYDRSAD